MIGIYKVTNPNGKVYIGQSIDIEKRIGEYNCMRNCQSQFKLFRSLKKYQPENHIFEILEECNAAELNTRERYYQEFYEVLSKNGLNCRLTTSDNKSGKNSLESNIRRSETMVGKNQGKRPDVSERNKTVHAGKIISNEHRESISKKLKGKPHAYQGPRGVTLRKAVLQYTKDRTVLLNEFISLAEASKPYWKVSVTLLKQRGVLIIQRCRVYFYIFI